MCFLVILICKQIFYYGLVNVQYSGNIIFNKLSKHLFFVQVKLKYLFHMCRYYMQINICSYAIGTELSDVAMQ